MDLIDIVLWIIERCCAVFGQGDPIYNVRMDRKNEKKNKKYFDAIFSFYYSKINEKFSPLCSSDNLLQTQAFLFWVEKQPIFDKLTPTQKNILVLMALCNEYEKTKNPEINSAIREYIDTFHITFADISHDVKLLLSVYEKIFNTKKIYNLQDLFTDIEIDYPAKLNEFSNKFSKDVAFQYVLKRLNQSEEFRSTIIRVIKEGKLATHGINQHTLRKLEEDLREKTGYAKTFLIIANKLPISIESYIKMQPGFQGTSRSPRNIPWLKGSHAFSIYIIRPNEGFRSSDELITKFQYLSTGFKQESLIAIFPIDGLNAKQFTIPSNKSFSNENIRKAFDISSYFMTGSQISDQDIWNVITQSEISVDEILSVMPFNILVPGIFPSEKDFLIKNYSKIQKKFRVVSLTDWATVDISLLENVLENLGEINYSPEEKRIIEPERLKNIAADIVQHSQLLKESLNFLV